MYKRQELARADVAACLNAEPNEIFFTSGGSEADNWAIKGIAHQLAKKGKKHIITSKFEHHAVLHTCASLEKEGFSVTYLDVHADGLVRPEELEAAIREDTALVTVMYANNEIGTIQPVSEIGAICQKHGVLFLSLIHISTRLTWLSNSRLSTKSGECVSTTINSVRGDNCSIASIGERNTTRSPELASIRSTICPASVCWRSTTTKAGL